MRRARSATLASAIVMLAASTAQAQRLRLTLVDSVGGAPIGGAIVTVLRADSTRHVEAIVGPSGMRVLPVHMPGTYRVRVRRVGYRPFLSGPITIAGVGDVPLVLRLPESRVPLPTVRTAARGRCDVGGPVDVAARETLEAVKTSLVSASVAWADQVDPIDVWLVSRRFSVSGRLLDSSRVVRPARTEEPFASDSAHLLHRDGYVRDELPAADRVYFLPSTHAMLSDDFVATHCFAVADDRGDADRVALRFEPLRSQRRPDVRGTMWLDRASGALTAVEFAFTGVTYRFFTTGATGRVELATLPSGARFIQSWSIRMPLFGRPGALRRPQQLGWKEDGGEARARVGPPEGEARLAGARERTGVGVGGRRR